MTLYYSGPEDHTNDADWSPAETGKSQIIENHADYAEITDDGELVINLDEIERAEKLTTLAFVAVDGVRDSDEYDVVTEPEFEWTGGE